VLHCNEPVQFGGGRATYDFQRGILIVIKEYLSSVEFVLIDLLRVGYFLPNLGIKAWRTGDKTLKKSEENSVTRRVPKAAQSCAAFSFAPMRL
jgi:hypothetical protein